MRTACADTRMHSSFQLKTHHPLHPQFVESVNDKNVPCNDCGIHFVGTRFHSSEGQRVEFKSRIAFSIAGCVNRNQQKRAYRTNPCNSCTESQETKKHVRIYVVLINGTSQKECSMCQLHGGAKAIRLKKANRKNNPAKSNSHNSPSPTHLNSSSCSTFQASFHQLSANGFGERCARLNCRGSYNPNRPPVFSLPRCMTKKA